MRGVNFVLIASIGFWIGDTKKKALTARGLTLWTRENVIAGLPLRLRDEQGRDLLAMAVPIADSGLTPPNFLN
jgi:hypothetical protein